MNLALQAAFEAHFAAEQSRLMNHAKSKLHNHHDAEDLVSRAALKAWRAWPKFNEGNFAGWIHRILANEIVTYARERNCRLPSGTATVELSYAAAQDAHMEYVEICRRIRELSPQQAHAVQRIAIDGASYEDAAREAGITVGGVRANLSRARRALHAVAV